MKLKRSSHQSLSSKGLQFDEFPVVANTDVIEDIDIVYNLRLTALSEAFFTSYFNLTNLTVCVSPLCVVSPRICRLNHLRELSLKNCQLETLDELPASIEALNLRSNKFKNVPKCLAKLPNLLDVHLDHNYITNISELTPYSRWRVSGTFNNNLIKSVNRSVLHKCCYHYLFLCGNPLEHIAIDVDLSKMQKRNTTIYVPCKAPFDYKDYNHVINVQKDFPTLRRRQELARKSFVTFSLCGRQLGVPRDLLIHIYKILWSTRFSVLWEQAHL